MEVSKKKVVLKKGRERFSLSKAMDMSQLYELQHDGVLIISSEKNLVYANKAFFNMCDLRPINFKNKPMPYENILDFEDRYDESIKQSLDEYIRDSYREVNLCINEKYCMKVSLSLNSLTNELDQVVGTLIIIKDLSEEWRLHMKYKGIIQELEDKNAELIKRATVFKKFVPDKFIEYLSKSDDDFEFNMQKVQKGIFSVMFIDVRDFTKHSESMSSQDCIEMMNSLFKIMQPCIKKHKGFIDKYLGDGLMALYEWDRNEEYSLAPIHAALDIHKELKIFNQLREAKGLEAIRIGIGVSTGHIILGMVGTEQRFESTAMGNAVNLAARMEFMTKQFKSDIIISEYTLHALNETHQFHTRRLGYTRVKGFQEKIAIHEVFDHNDDVLRNEKERNREKTDLSAKLIQNEQYGEAMEILDALVNESKHDPLPKLMLDDLKLEIRAGQ